MAHLLEHLLFKGTQAPRRTSRRSSRAAARAATAPPPTTAPTTSRRCRATDDEPRLGARHGGRPHGQLVRAQGRPRQRDDGGAQRVRDAARTSPAACCSSACSGSPSRRTTTATRSSARARTSRSVPIERLQAFYRTWYQPDNALLIVGGKFDEAQALALVAEALRRDPAPDARAAPALHRRADAGRRAHGDAAARRRQCSSSSAHVPRAGRRATRTTRRSTCWRTSSATAPTGRLHRALVQKGLASSRLGLRAHAARPGLREFRRARSARTAPLEPARDALLAALEGADARADHRRRGRARAHRAAQRLREGAARFGALVRSLARVRLDGRLAPVLPLPRAPAQGDHWPTCSASPSTYLKPANRVLGDVRADRPARPRRDPAARRTCARRSPASRAARAVQPGEAFDPTPHNIEKRA